MNYKKLLDEIDSSLAATSIKYDGFFLWPHIRSKLSIKLTKIGASDKAYERIKLLSFLRLFCSSLLSFFKLLLFRKYRTVYFNSSSGYMYDNNNVIDAYLGQNLKGLDKYFYITNISNLRAYDSLRHSLGKGSLVAENYFIKLLLKPFIYLYKLRLKRNNKKISKYHIDTLFNEIFSRFSKLISKDELVSYIAEYCVQYTFYKVILGRAKISDAYLISSYSKQPIVAALNKIDANVTEIQHGLGGKEHLSYGYTQSSQEAKYPTIDILYVYDDFWLNSFSGCEQFKLTSIKVFGNKKLEYSMTNQEMSISSIIGNKYFILITGQGLFVKEYMKFISELCDCAPENIVIVYRPHPSEISEQVAKLENKYYNFAYLDSRRFTTEQLISKCLCHVSIYSACHFDAITLNGKTFCYDIYENSPIKDYLENSDAFVCISNARELLDYIDVSGGEENGLSS